MPDRIALARHVRALLHELDTTGPYDSRIALMMVCGRQVAFFARDGHKALHHLEATGAVKVTAGRGGLRITITAKGRELVHGADAETRLARWCADVMPDPLTAA